MQSYRSLLIGLSAGLLLGCASPPRSDMPPQAARSAVPATTHESYFARLIVVAAAMGGNNPNPGYRALSARRCAGGRQAGNTAAAIDSGTLQQTTVSASCQRLAAAK